MRASVSSASRLGRRKARASCDRLEVLDFACLRLEPGLLVGNDRAQSRLGGGGLALHFLDPAAERQEVRVIACDEHVLVRAVGAQRDHGRFGRSLAGGLGVGCLDSNEGDDRQGGEDRGGERLLLEPESAVRGLGDAVRRRGENVLQLHDDTPGKMAGVSVAHGACAIVRSDLIHGRSPRGRACSCRPAQERFRLRQQPRPSPREARD